ncbi:alpha/beta hydrolase [Streptomyces sp. NPDC051954]|uniref:alpha/beta fold hydrolase n=1 Tax=unclassified Streptomyces TaxID=2593676 RepID=UPI00342461F2
MNVISPDGVRLSVNVRGSGTGTRILLLHGVASSRRTYDWLPRDVTDGRECISYDFRGHGESGHQPGTYDLGHYYDDTVQVIEKVGAPVVVVGFSLGGLVGWQLAQRRPDLVRAAFLEDPPLFFEEIYDDGVLPDMLRFTIEQEMDWLAREVSVDEAARELAGNPLGPERVWGDLHHPDSVRVLAEATLARDRGTMEAAIDATMVSGVDRESPLQVPVSIIGGDREFGAVFGHAHAAQLRERHPEVEVHNVVGAPHCVHDSFAGREDYLAWLSPFLAKYAEPDQAFSA